MKMPRKSVFSSWPWESLWLVMLKGPQLHKQWSEADQFWNTSRSSSCPSEQQWSAYHLSLLHQHHHWWKNWGKTKVNSSLWWAWVKRAPEIGHIHQALTFHVSRVLPGYKIKYNGSHTKKEFYLKSPKVHFDFLAILEGFFNDNFGLRYLCLS